MCICVCVFTHLQCFFSIFLIVFFRLVKVLSVLLWCRIGGWTSKLRWCIIWYGLPAFRIYCLHIGVEGENISNWSFGDHLPYSHTLSACCYSYSYHNLSSPLRFAVSHFRGNYIKIFNSDSLPAQHLNKLSMKCIIYLFLIYLEVLSVLVGYIYYDITPWRTNRKGTYTPSVATAFISVYCLLHISAFVESIIERLKNT